MMKIFFPFVNTRHELLRDRRFILEFVIFYCELTASDNEREVNDFFF